MAQTIVAVVNKDAEQKEPVYKTVFITNADRKETVIKIGAYQEARAALEAAEADAKSGKKYDLAKGHFALLVADPRETETATATEEPKSAKAAAKNKDAEAE